MLLLDAVLDLAAGAVEIFVEGPSVDLGGAERGHDEARVRTLGQVLGLGDNPPIAAPAIERAPSEVSEATRGSALGRARDLSLGELFADRADQAFVAGEAEQIVDPMGFAPRHQLVPGEAGIRPQQDLDPGPARPDLGGDPSDLVDGAGRGVDVRAPEPGRQQMPAAEHVQRQVAVES